MAKTARKQDAPASLEFIRMCDAVHRAVQPQRDSITEQQRAILRQQHTSDDAADEALAAIVQLHQQQRAIDSQVFRLFQSMRNIHEEANNIRTRYDLSI